MRPLLWIPAFAPSVVGVFFMVVSSPVLAQITPDSTLGNEGSIVLPNQTVKGLPADLIQGGASRGTSLFHSFLEFNVNDGQRVYFDNPTGIDRILSRVTGSDVSDIFGTLGVNGGADLFFLNPNGIIFGPNAQLDLNGSFTASTADSAVFDNGFNFSATNSNSPPLLTINIPIGLQVGQNPRSIQNFSRSLNSSGEITGLTVDENESITLLAGDLIIDRGYITAPNGMIQLIAIKDSPNILIPTDPLLVELNSNYISEFGNIFLSNASLDVSGTKGGCISIYGNDITIQDRSNVSSITEGNSVGQGIFLKATGDIHLTGASRLESESYGIGQGGNITIEASNLNISDRSFISTMTLGSGAAGNLSIETVDDISITGNGYDILQNAYFLQAFLGILKPTVRSAGIFSGTGYNGGQGGSVLIISKNLNLSSGAIIFNPTFGSGDLGEVNISVKNSIDMDESALIVTQLVGSSGLGNDLTITSNQLILSNGGYASIPNLGNGSPGNISIQAQEIQILEKPINVIVTPGIVSATAFGKGGSGNILVNTHNLTIQNGGQITSQSGTIELANFFKIPEFLIGGSAGSITINATGNIFLSGISASGITNSAISAETYSSSSAGNILINADQLTLKNQAEVQGATGSSGTAGNIFVTANIVDISDRSRIVSTSTGSGNAGNINLNVGRLLSLSGEKAGVFVTSEEGATGNSGTIAIQQIEGTSDKPTVSLSQEATLSASTAGQANAGSIRLQNIDILKLNSGTISTEITETGEATQYSDITIDANALVLNNGSAITSSTAGVGNAGTISITARQGVTLDQSSIISTAVQLGARGNAQQISIVTPDLGLNNSSQITASTSGFGNAGQVDIIGMNGGSAQRINLENNSSITTAVNAGAIGNAGQINLKTQQLNLTNSSQLASSTDGQGRAGRITVKDANSITLNGSTISTAILENGTAETINQSDRGNISVFTQNLDLNNASSITARTSGFRDLGFNNAGQIDIKTGITTLHQGATIQTNTAGSGIAGNINFIATEGLFISGNNSGIFSSTEDGSSGNAGNITIDPPIVDLVDGAGIAVNSFGSGTGGNIILVAGDLNLSNQSFISALTRSSGGGNITLTIDDQFTLRDRSFISTEAGTAQAGGDGGNINLNGFFILGSNNSDIIANAYQGNGGNININTQGLFGFTIKNVSNPKEDPNNNVTASSQFGSSGNTNINSAIDPSKSLAVLDVNVADLSNQIDRRCDLARTPNASRFIVTGKGGLPPNDRNRLSLHPLWTSLDLTADFSDPKQQFYAEGKYAEAIDSWETVLRTSELLPEQQIPLFSNLAQAHASQGDWDKAEDAIEQGLNLVSTALSLDSLVKKDLRELNRLRAQLLTTQSYLLTERGQLEQALSLTEQASQIYQDQNDHLGIIQTHLNEAQILTRQGNLRLASDRLITAQSMLGTSENNTLKGAIDLELGTVQRLTGDYTTAQTTLERSATVFSQTGTVNYATALLALGDNDRDQFVPLNRQFNNIQEQITLTPPNARGDAETRAGKIISRYNSFSNQALTHYRQVQATAPTTGLRLQALTQEFLMTIDLTTSRNRPDWSAVNLLSEQIQHQLKQLPLSSTRLYSNINLTGRLLALQGKNTTSVTPEALTTLLTQAMDDALTLGDRRAQIQTLSMFGSFYEQQQAWKESQQFTEAALTLAQEMGETDLTYRLSWQLGRLQYAQGNLEGAIASYTDSIQTLNTLRNDLNTASAEVRFSFRDVMDPIYREMVSLLLSQDTPEKPRPENVIQARDLIESLQLSELVNFFQSNCDVSNLSKIDELDPHSAVIYPIILSDRLEVIVSLPGKSLQHYATSLPKGNLTQGIYLIQRELADPLSRRYLPLVQELYDAIIRPVEADLQSNNIENLVFVLDGSLRNLPMSILHDGEQFLVEKYAIAVTPGLQLFDPQPLQKQRLTALVGGLTEARQGFPELPNVKAEMASIENTIPSDVLLDDQFVEQNLTTEISSSTFPIVHLATHGEFGSTAEDTYILTWDDRVDVNEFSTLLQGRIGNRPVELLILSACRTAAGDDRAALGLAGIAVRSGARSTLASLWYISDEATSVLMGKLYEVLGQQKVTKAEALRDAQLELLHNPQYAHPYYWAPFVLVGNWL